MGWAKSVIKTGGCAISPKKINYFENSRGQMIASTSLGQKPQIGFV